MRYLTINDSDKRVSPFNKLSPPKGKVEQPQENASKGDSNSHDDKIDTSLRKGLQ